MELENCGQQNSPVTKRYKRKSLQALRVARDIQDHIKEYSRKLDQVRDKITKVSPEKWIDEECDNVSNDEDELNELDQ
jgi:hypothetical protein